MPDRWRDLSTRSLLMDSDGAPVAAGMIWTSTVHRTRYWTSIFVAPQFRRRGFGGALMTALSEVRESPLPLKWRGNDGSIAMVFADGIGASTVQVVPPRTVLTDNAGLLRSETRTVDGTVTGIDEAAAAWVDLYRWTHELWSPMAVGSDAAVLSDFRADIDLGASRFTQDEDGRITAGAFAFRSGSEWEVCAETRSSNQHRGEQLVASCVAGSLRSLADTGVHSVDFDGHVSDQHFLPVLSRLRPTGSWFRIVEWRP
ncbi:MAG: GNAT family N-acetyltransferase [Nakamurella sp.]